MPNRLANATSPYLLQHAENPVDWWPWCEEAIDAAQSSQRPIFLSIGYSACHWCHVMERESFENPQIADYLNQHFVSIKVDREERPDLDQIYMNAVQLMTKQGGWPLSAFLTPDLQPFYGGTYWPPEPRFNRPSFLQVLHAVIDAWENRREQAIEQAQQLTDHLQRISSAAPGELDESLARLPIERLADSFDEVHGGFGQAPKFPRATDLQWLLRHAALPHAPSEDRDAALKMAVHTLDKMAAGGIYDHVGGGFARYSTDDQWLVPHFEKMLYDNALLTTAYLDAWMATGQPRYWRVVDETIRYVLRDMTHPEGGFYSSEDADSEGVEGKFYVWSLDELQAILGEELTQVAMQAYGASSQGNFEGRNLLYLPRPLPDTADALGVELEALMTDIEEIKRKLLAARSQRVRPSRDEKILTSWNAYMIDSMARAGAAAERPDFVAAAAQAATFIREHLQDEQGRLLHCCRLDAASPANSAPTSSTSAKAFLEDYAALIGALATLYESTWDEHWIDWAADLADQLIRHYHDEDGGGFYFTANDHESLITRNKDIYDASVPSGNAMAATSLLRLGLLCDRQDWIRAAESTLEMAAESMRRSPLTGQLFIALDWLQSDTEEVIVLAKPHTAPVIAKTLQSAYAPRRVTALRVVDADAHRSPHLESAFAGKSCVDDVSMYICQNHACEAPLHGLTAVRAASQRL